jgi:hypothetical protein
MGKKHLLLFRRAKTTAVSYPISRLNNKNGKFGGLNLKATLNDDYRVTGF